MVQTYLVIQREGESEAQEPEDMKAAEERHGGRHWLGLLQDRLYTPACYLVSYTENMIHIVDSFVQILQPLSILSQNYECNQCQTPGGKLDSQ